MLLLVFASGALISGEVISVLNGVRMFLNGLMICSGGLLVKYVYLSAAHSNKRDVVSRAGKEPSCIRRDRSGGTGQLQ